MTWSRGRFYRQEMSLETTNQMAGFPVVVDFSFSCKESERDFRVNNRSERSIAHTHTHTHQHTNTHTHRWRQKLELQQTESFLRTSRLTAEGLRLGHPSRPQVVCCYYGNQPMVEGGRTPFTTHT